MPSTQQIHAVERLLDAARTPDQWPAALQHLAQVAGGIGVGHVIHDKRSGAVEWVAVTGPCAELEPRYIDFYASRDLFAPVLFAAQRGRWLPLSRAVPRNDIRRNEWYNDFIIKGRIADILAAKVYEDEFASVLLGIQRGAASERAARQFKARVRALQQPLARAAGLHIDFRRMSRTLCAARHALRCLSVGVVLADREGLVLETNELAAEILDLKDGLQVKSGRLAAVRSFDTAKLAASLSRHGAPAAAQGHLLIGRRGGARPHAVTIAPLSGERTSRESRVNLVLIVNPDWQTPSTRALAEFFGLSAAESRLTASLMNGGKLSEIAKARGVEITTLRTQLSSIMRKVGVERQVDLVRVLSNIRTAGPRSA